MPLYPFPLEIELAPGSRVCVAVSGGADSVGLLRVLHAANIVPREPLGIAISAVHVHHGLRGGEADGDASFVGDLCARLEIPLAIHRVDTPAHRARTGKTTEEAARTLRYGVFHEILGSDRADAVLTAHTLDDQAETVLMKLLRGAWTEGLGGIHPVLHPPGLLAKRILRPLLHASRAQIVEYLDSLSQPWREDSSNADPTHTRNRLRHQILPLLRAENPSLDRTLAHLAELARDEEDRWQRELTRMLPQILLPGAPVRGGGRSVSTGPGEHSVALEIDRLRALDNASRRRVLRAAARTLRASPQSEGVRLSFDETSRLLALCGLRKDPTVAPRPGTALSLSQGLRAKRTPRELQLTLIPANTVAKH